MTAFLKIERSFCPLVRDWGYSVRTWVNDDGAWGSTEGDAIRRLWPRLKARGYTTYHFV